MTIRLGAKYPGKRRMWENPLGNVREPNGILKI